MQLVINTYGAYLRKSGNCFLVKREDKIPKNKDRMAIASPPSTRRRPIAVIWKTLPGTEELDLNVPQVFCCDYYL
jgi:hypothetical protein